LTQHANRAHHASQHETGNTVAPFPALSAGVRWHCAWTGQQREAIAARSIEAAGFAAYLPLHYQPGLASRYRIVPLFPRYVFTAFSPEHDAWGKITAARGVCGLIQHGPGLPTALPDHAIAELLARTSARGIVDDPGESAWEPAGAGQRPTWEPMAGMDEAGRLRLLIRLFGQSAARYRPEDAA
jgi:hypothetical protein